MCDHSDSYRFSSWSRLGDDPTGPDHCHIYSVHQDGTVYIQPHVRFSGGATEDKAFCGDDRLTLIQLPTSIAKDGARLVEVACSDTPTSREELRAAPVPAETPSFFLEKLKSICPHCHCKSEILWHNLHRREPHFDACFRYVDGTLDGKDRSYRRCFIKLYTMKVPFLSNPMVTFSMVHHIRAEGDKFVKANRTTGDNQEHMFAFIAGLKGRDIGWLLEDLVIRWRDIARDHLKKTAGSTPRLLMAALLSEYGAIISERILHAGKTLKDCDESLATAIKNLKEEVPETAEEIRKRISEWNEKLFEMNKHLTGTRSIMHYLAESAHVLVEGITPFETYVKERLKEWANPNSAKLADALPELDTFKEQIRDNDKLVMVRKNMLQYKMDIKSLQQHIDINVGMVTNLIAERDRVIQQSIQTNTERDGFKMKLMAILTALLLPATFMAIFLTTPMFDWDPDTPVVRKHPTVIYWGFTGPATLVLVICLCFMTHPIWFCWIIDTVPLLSIFHCGSFYRACEQRSYYITARNSKRETTTKPDDGAIYHDGTTGNEVNGNEVNGKNVEIINKTGSSCTTTSLSRGGAGPQLSAERMV